MSGLLERIEEVQAGTLSPGDYLPERDRTVGGVHPHPGGKVLVVLLAKDKTRTPLVLGLREPVKVIRKGDKR